MLCHIEHIDMVSLHYVSSYVICNPRLDTLLQFQFLNSIVHVAMYFKIKIFGKGLATLNALISSIGLDFPQHVYRGTFCKSKVYRDYVNAFE